MRHRVPPGSERALLQSVSKYFEEEKDLLLNEGIEPRIIAFSVCRLNFALEYAIRRVQVNQNELKLNGIYHILVYADDDNILGGSVNTIKKNTGALIAASKEIGLEVNVDKIKYVVMSRDQNAGLRK